MTPNGPQNGPKINQNASKGRYPEKGRFALPPPEKVLVHFGSHLRPKTPPKIDAKIDAEKNVKFNEHLLKK